MKASIELKHSIILDDEMNVIYKLSNETLNEKLLQKRNLHNKLMQLSQLIFIPIFHSKLCWWNLTKQLTEKLNND